VLALRRAKSMVVDPSDGNSRSVGSFFTNPIVSSSELQRILERWAGEGDRSVMPSYPTSGGIKLSAAWLVEKSGFTKGLRRGGVGISQHHALALINVNGTTEEILALEREIRSAVAARFGVELEREPVVVPPSGEAGA
jgi:UDP-N-acetylmuramate dehydrogenase